MDNKYFNPAKLAISIVSHGQGALIEKLLQDLMPIIKVGVEVLITLNIPEDESFLGEFADSLIIIRNKTPLGFGENHNNANLCTDRYWFAVLNPDIRCDPFIFSELIAAHQYLGAGVTAPRIVGINGRTEDSVRFYPTLNRIFARVWLRFLGRDLVSDYKLDDGRNISVDWIAGMFLLFKSNDYRCVGGFEVRYFMYLEDADICRRLNLKGLPVIVISKIEAIHDARRATGRSFKHFCWHVSSLIRFLFIAPWSEKLSPLIK
jgi:N-acetylglucosaminyl-diphospho-decaprenol L-rhamnosyltransferase